MGHNKWATLTLRELVKSRHDVVAVVTETDEFDKKEEKNYKKFAGYGAYESLKDVANSLDLPLYQPEDANSQDFLDTIDSLNPDLIVMVSYHAIIKAPLLRKYENKIINAHVAYLPYYRGRAPINWAIINDDDCAGVTVHFIDEGIDTGPIIMQEKVKIEADDSTIDVLLKALPMFSKLVLKSIDLIENDKY